MLNKLLIPLILLVLSFNTLAGDRPKVRIETSMGNIELELNRIKAPTTVANFLQYAKDGFYNNTLFHRVAKNFLIQGGGFTPELVEKTTRAPIKNEADNGLKNITGTIAMARNNMPNSATAQFFINTSNNDFFNFRSKTIRGWGYAVFGKVTGGMDVVKRIENSATGAKGPFSQEVPLKDIVIIKVVVISE